MNTEMFCLTCEMNVKKVCCMTEKRDVGKLGMIDWLVFIIPSGRYQLQLNLFMGPPVLCDHFHETAVLGKLGRQKWCP